jgi:hypothetical protein
MDIKGSPLLITWILFGFASPNAETKKANLSQIPKGFAVVELFTSEGCSSCPPADEAVGDLVKEYKQNVFVIGFHVDYWDRLGWKDRFSNAAYSNRQKQYGSILGLNSVYTPQIIVNGRTEFVGSDRNKLRQTVESSLKMPGGKGIVVRAKSATNKSIDVNCSFSSSAGSILNVVLIELSDQSDVKSGENSGRKLKHINLARDYRSFPVSNKEVSVTLTLPPGLSAKDCKVIAYIQDKKDWRVEAAASTDIEFSQMLH